MGKKFWKSQKRGTFFIFKTYFISLLILLVCSITPRRGTALRQTSRQVAEIGFGSEICLTQPKVETYYRISPIHINECTVRPCVSQANALSAKLQARLSLWDLKKFWFGKSEGYTLFLFYTWYKKIGMFWILFRLHIKSFNTSIFVMEHICVDVCLSTSMNVEYGTYI